MSEERPTGFAAMPSYIARDGTIDTSTKALLLVLSSFAGADQSCWPTNKTLSAATGLHEATVRRLLRAAESRGLITTTERTDANGAMLANKYRLNFGKWGGIENDSEARTKHQGEGRVDARGEGAPTLGGGAHPRAPNKTIQQDHQEQDLFGAVERKEKKPKFVRDNPPTRDEVSAYFAEKGLPRSANAIEVRKFFDHYDDPDVNWTRMRGNKVVPLTTWRGAVSRWITRWQERNPQLAGVQQRPALTQLDQHGRVRDM